MFDHNVRKTKAHHKDGQEKLKGGNAVQTPLQIVHGDYTLASAPLRVKMLSDKPKVGRFAPLCWPWDARRFTSFEIARTHRAV